jgi:ATP-binding cassette subfamily F protein 3
MKRVATCIVEVRDGRVTNYRGDYEAYLYSVNKEIDEGERQQGKGLSKPPPSLGKPAKGPHRAARRTEREIRKEMTNLERTIARLDDQKRQTNEQLFAATEPAEALRLHNEVAALTMQLAEAEDRWCQLQEEIDVQG